MTYVRSLMKELHQTRNEILYRLPYVHGLLYLHDLLVANGVEVRWATGGESWSDTYDTLRKTN